MLPAGTNSVTRHIRNARRTNWIPDTLSTLSPASSWERSLREGKAGAARVVQDITLSFPLPTQWGNSWITHQGLETSNNSTRKFMGPGQGNYHDSTLHKMQTSIREQVIPEETGETKLIKQLPGCKSHATVPECNRTFFC